MHQTAGRVLAPAVLLTALTLSPALGYATTFVLLALMALATVLWLSLPDPSVGTPLPFTGEGDQRSWWRGEPQAPALLFALAFALIALSTLLTVTDPTPLLGFTALLFYFPLAQLLRDPPPRSGGGGPGEAWWGGRPLPTLALLGTAIGLITALALRYGLGQTRAAEGFFLTDPYRLAVTTLLLATLALGALFTRAPLRWLAPLGLVAALAVVVLTGSRTTLLGLPVLLLITALCFVRRPLTIAAVLVATAGIVVAALFVELPGTARTRLWDVLVNIAQGGQVSDVAIALRLLLYRFGLEQFWTSPIVGHGWSEAMMAPVLAHLTPEQLSWGKLVHLHNDAIQFAVAGGLLGLIASLLMLAAPLAGYLALPPQAKGPAKLHATLVLVIGYAVLGLPDLMLASPLQLTLYVTLTAAVLNARPAGVSS